MRKKEFDASEFVFAFNILTDLGMNECHPGFTEAEAGGTGVQGHPKLCSEFQTSPELGLVVHTFNPSTREADLCEFKASLVYITSYIRQPELHSESLSQTPARKEKEKD